MYDLNVNDRFHRIEVTVVRGYGNDGLSGPSLGYESTTGIDKGEIRPGSFDKSVVSVIQNSFSCIAEVNRDSRCLRHGVYYCS